MWNQPSLSQPGALRHLALNRLHGEQCKRDEPAGHICRQVKPFFLYLPQLQIVTDTTAGVTTRSDKWNNNQDTSLEIIFKVLLCHTSSLLPSSKNDEDSSSDDPLRLGTFHGQFSFLLLHLFWVAIFLLPGHLGAHHQRLALHWGQTESGQRDVLHPVRRN